MITFVAVLFAIFHFYTSMFGSFPPSLQRPIHVVFAAVLAFLLSASRRDRKKNSWLFFDIILRCMFENNEEKSRLISTLNYLKFFIRIIYLIIKKECRVSKILKKKFQELN